VLFVEQELPPGQTPQIQLWPGVGMQPAGTPAQDGGVVGSVQIVCRQPKPPSSEHGLKQQFATQSGGIGSHRSTIIVQGGGFG
jgi:hypothetical protein